MQYQVSTMMTSKLEKHMFFFRHNNMSHSLGESAKTRRITIFWNI
jgi:hypothetical protein